VLRRIAGHLYWAARNLERAEWRARLVDVNYHLLIETPPRGSEPWAPLLAIFGERETFAARYPMADEDSVLNFFVLDLENPNSIRNCIVNARNNMLSLRHYISSELWIELNTLYLDAQAWSPGLFSSPGVFAFFSELRENFYQLSGILQTTIPRDLAYDFIQIGMMLERAEDVARMLDVKYHFLLPKLEDVGGPVDLLQWAAVLRSASGLEAYRKRHGNSIEVRKVVSILLFDASFPRSARFSLDQLAVSLKRIAAERTESSEESRSSPQSQSSSQSSSSQSCATSPEHFTALSQLDASLKNDRSSQVLKSGLHQFLLEIQDGCAAIGDEVFARYLRSD
jgi:uncharacterized alpha-E superfamily protein